MVKPFAARVVGTYEFQDGLDLERIVTTLTRLLKQHLSDYALGGRLVGISTTGELRVVEIEMVICGTSWDSIDNVSRNLVEDSVTIALDRHHSGAVDASSMDGSVSERVQELGRVLVAA